LVKEIDIFGQGNGGEKGEMEKKKGGKASF